ncbi:MAG: hypothetical protein U0T73_09240 [Chitinophagales bacterium]
MRGAAALLIISIYSLVLQAQHADSSSAPAFMQRMQTIAQKAAKGFARLSYNDDPDSNTTTGSRPYRKYRNRVIRKIEITVFRPFGTDIQDSTKVIPMNRFEKGANRFHTRTRSWAVRNDLLFREGQRLNPQRIADSEQQLWSRNTFKNLRIYVVPIQTDSVDVFILAQDRFTFQFLTSFEFYRLRVNLNLINFLGAPQTLTVGAYVSAIYHNWFGVNVGYSYDNIAGTHINASVRAAYEKIGFSVEGSVTRPFFSADTKWGGAFIAGWQNTQVQTINDYTYFYNQSNHYEDLRLVYAIKRTDTSAQSAQRLHPLVALRYQHLQYGNRPFLVRGDGVFKFAGYDRLLWAVGLASWNYYEERTVYLLGQKEYIPKGPGAQLIMGVERDELFGKRAYAGFHFQYGRYFPVFGYSLFDAGAGGYTNFNKIEQTHVALQHHYYSPLLSLGKWHVRHFIGNFFYFGFDRPPGSSFQVTERYGLKGLNYPVFRAERVIAANFETSFYLPKKIMGFNASIFVNCDLAYLGFYGWQPQFHPLVQQAYGSGMRLRIPNFGLDIIEVGLYYYPFSYLYNIFPVNPSGGTANPRQAAANNLYNLDALHVDY